MKVVLVLLFATVYSAVGAGDIKKILSDSSDGSEAESCECVPDYRCKRDKTDPASNIDIRSDTACDDYLSVCCSIQDIIHENIADTRSSQNRKECGVRNPDGVGFRITTGGNSSEAQNGEFPWMALVLRKKKNNFTERLMYHCGGALIHPQVVTTAAHCLHDQDAKLKVRLGEWDTQTQNELFSHQDRDVKTVIIHSEFKADLLTNDIALLFLENPVEIAENVDVVCLPKQDMVLDDSKCFATGWGKNRFDGGNYQGILKKVELPLVPRNSCQGSLRKTQLGNKFELHSSFICAGGVLNEDTCQGDGGGPLVCPVPGLPGRYLQAGIVSWGVGCGDDQVPGVYTNVAKYSDWIDKQLTQNNFSVSYYKY